MQFRDFVYSDQGKMLEMLAISIYMRMQINMYIGIKFEYHSSIQIERKLYGVGTKTHSPI